MQGSSIAHIGEDGTCQEVLEALQRHSLSTAHGMIENPGRQKGEVNVVKIIYCIKMSDREDVEVNLIGRLIYLCSFG